MTTALAPGKLILSGEHAVVHGSPALALAVNRFAKTTVSASTPAHIGFELRNLPYHASMTVGALRQIKRQLKARYQAFSQGEVGIRDVLKLPFELSQYAVSKLLGEHPDHGAGMHVTTESTIPIGCGMGSSAAMIVSMLHAIASYQGLVFDEERYFQQAVDTENLQHGRSSGLDIRLALRGGCLYYHQGVCSPRPIPDLPLYLINTGKPLSSTGECVAKTSALFAADPKRLNAFTRVTDMMEAALNVADMTGFAHAVRENHRLLVELGVVPQRVQDLINALVEAGFAAKVCGAGAVLGEQAGIVLVVAAEPPTTLCQRLGYRLDVVYAEPRGVRLEEPS